MTIFLPKNSTDSTMLFVSTKLALLHHLNREFIAPHLVLSFIPIQIVTFTVDRPLNVWTEGRLVARQTGPVALIQHPDTEGFYLGVRNGKLEAVAGHEVLSAIKESTNN